MKISKRAAITLSAIAIIVGAGAVSAARASTTQNNFVSGLVSAIAQKFNLNPADVQQVFDQQTAQHRQQMLSLREQNFTARINAAVTSGALTKDQADKILAKEQEVKNFVTGLEGKSAADQKTAIQTEIASLKQWAADNNIPLQYLMNFGWGFNMHAMGFGMMMAGKFAAAGTVTSVSGSTITLTGKNGATYTVDASAAAITKLAPPSGGAAGSKTSISVSDIKTGDALTVQGTVNGSTIAATQIFDGPLAMGGRKGFGFHGMMMGW